MWQSAQPTDVKSCLPRVMEALPPGVVVEGSGGARKRMKKANFSTSLIASAPVAAFTSVVSLGTVLNWQASSRSCGNISLLMPCSTLYASPAKISSDLFWAFHPKRAIVPSLPLRFGSPVGRTRWGRPKMPSVSLGALLAAWLATMAASGIASIRPRPNVGVGIRKLTLW